MPKKAETHIQKSAPGPPTAIAPVTPRIFPGPTRIAELKRNAARGEIPVSTLRFSAMIAIPFLKWVTCIKPNLKLKKIPDPTNKIIAKEKLPKTGIFAYHSKFVGKSQRKSDNGPIKEKMPLMYSKIACIPIPLSFRKSTLHFMCFFKQFMYQFAHSSKLTNPEIPFVCQFHLKFHVCHLCIIYR